MKEMNNGTTTYKKKDYGCNSQNGKTTTSWRCNKEKKTKKALGDVI